MRMIWRVTRVSLIGYLGLLLLLMFFEESLVFVPQKYPSGNWSPAGVEFADAEFTASDGVRLHGWYVESDNPRAVVLFCHGNAGNITHRVDRIEELVDQLGCSLLLFDYRGYGRSEGKPTEEGILLDARAARAWLAERAGVSEEEIVLVGHSLGGAVAVDLAAKDGARGLILENTFARLPDVAAVHYPWAPVRLLMRTEFNSIEKIAGYHGPLLQCHGDADEVVPFEQGKLLFEAAVSSRKHFHVIPGGLHNTPHPEWWVDELDQFLQSLPVAQTPALAN